MASLCHYLSIFGKENQLEQMLFTLMYHFLVIGAKVDSFVQCTAFHSIPENMFFCNTILIKLYGKVIDFQNASCFCT